jgi:TIR domain
VAAKCHKGGVVGGIFINYRGEDSQTAAALIDRDLTARFGSEQVFLDSRSIPAGSDLLRSCWGGVRSCSVLLVVIGPRWLTVTDAAGERRIDDPRDWLRREIVEALIHGLRVVPVLAARASCLVSTHPAAVSSSSARRHVHHHRRRPRHMPSGKAAPLAER